MTAFSGLTKQKLLEHWALLFDIVLSLDYQEFHIESTVVNVKTPLSLRLILIYFRSFMWLALAEAHTATGHKQGSKWTTSSIIVSWTLSKNQNREKKQWTNKQIGRNVPLWHYKRLSLKRQMEQTKINVPGKKAHLKSEKMASQQLLEFVKLSLGESTQQSQKLSWDP